MTDHLYSVKLEQAPRQILDRAGDPVLREAGPVAGEQNLWSLLDGMHCRVMELEKVCSRMKAQMTKMKTTIPRRDIMTRITVFLVVVIDPLISRYSFHGRDAWSGDAEKLATVCYLPAPNFLKKSWVATAGDMPVNYCPLLSVWLFLYLLMNYRIIWDFQISAVLLWIYPSGKRPSPLGASTRTEIRFPIQLRIGLVQSFVLLLL
jgi:hypothetical protein